MPYVLPDGRRVAPEQKFYLNGSYPSNWLKKSTEAQRTALGITWEADPAQPEPAPPTVEQLLARAAAKRWEIETGGITHETFGAIPTDERTRGVLTAGYVKATANSEYAITDWKIGPGVYATLNAATIIAMADAVEAHVQSCFTANKAVDAKINDETYTTYAAVDGASEWP